MSPRTRFLAYLVGVHVLVALAALPLLARQRLWLLVLELAIAVSLAGGFILVERVLALRAVAHEAALLLRDGDFTVRLSETGEGEVDELVRAYNALLDRLREERARQQEQHLFLGQILRASPAGVLTCDFDGRIDFANPRAESLIGGGIRGRRLSDLPPPWAEELPALAPGLSRVVALAAGRKIRCTSGEFFDRGFVRRFVLIEELTDDLRDSERAAYSRVVRVVAHEVNNSVTAARSLVESSLHYVPQIAEEDRRELEAALRLTIARLDQLTRFVAGFADVLRLPAPRRMPTDIGGLVRGVAQLLRAESDRRRVAWRLEIAAALPPVALDPVQVEQALINVAKNALEAIGVDGEVTVRLELYEGGQRLVLQDTGPGLTEEARANVFTPFFSTKDGGQGIGLTLVREVLDRHGFDYGLDSPPGGGTRFEILLR